ncbi:ATPase [Colletotrichum graminicola]|uniref:ATPase n=1 Tax=Colletotrichum graminicola (strain M1.001 / M2 / FGSC 10212) TaxID=645133 RepID=E3Q9Z2_COLGM|nr:ATPase [Colletotrichum graminicola M1.001]EFQ27680.1 ATPase [Colletotrichum graminicola M1.001]WDK11648.1 ATPase [Colletotrichum graminicola]
MAKTIDGKVRPLAPFDKTLEKATLKGASRIYVNRDALIQLTGSIDNGRRCIVTRTAAQDATKSAAELRREAALWTLSDKNISPNIILMSEAYREACGFDLGDHVTITMCEKSAVPDAETVNVLPMTTSEREKADISAWEGAWIGVIRFYLARAEQVFPGMKFECVASGVKQTFRITTVDGQTDNVARYVVSTVTRIVLGEGEEPVQEVVRDVKRLVVSNIPGLHAEEQKLRSFFRGFNTNLVYKGQQKSCGIVIHGGRGTGKSYILSRIAATGWGRVFRIEENDKSSTVEEVFKQARTMQPSIVLIDGLQALIGKDRANSTAIIQRLGQQLDQLAEDALKNGTLPKVVVVATCLDYMTDVPPELQKRTRFERNIALSIPNAEGRLEILKSFDIPIQPEIKDAMLDKLAQQTHAFNASDLDRLIENSMMISAERLDPDEAGYDEETMGTPYLSREDLEQALRSTRPTAMHDVNLKPPTIHWQDVGGQESLKSALRNMITLTTTNDPGVQKLILTPPKGLLLYGPPGCSKTLSAQAMATESGFNFFAVKGAELLNMYVGESERAVRQLFERARAASPSIIFFDEIDSIGGQRAGGAGGGGGAAAAKSQGSVNMLTTLLTEMDGFEALSGVLILAATNRPEAMDPALLRPGRFDRIVYVGPPDAAGREAVFNLYLRKLPLAPDIDVAELSRLSEGFSGAEIKQIVNVATEPALSKALNRTTAGKEGEQARVCMEDIVQAIQLVPKGITRQMLDGYDKWSKQFMKHQNQK